MMMIVIMMIMMMMMTIMIQAERLAIQHEQQENLRRVEHVRSIQHQLRLKQQQLLQQQQQRQQRHQQQQLLQQQQLQPTSSTIIIIIINIINTYNINQHHHHHSPIIHIPKLPPTKQTDHSLIRPNYNFFTIFDHTHTLWRLI